VTGSLAAVTAAASEPAAQRLGIVELLDDAVLSGWAADLALPGQPAALLLVVDGLVTSQFVCSIPRADLNATDSPEMALGFRFRLPESVLDGHPQQIGIRFRSGEQLPHAGPDGSLRKADLAYQHRPGLVGEGRRTPQETRKQAISRFRKSIDDQDPSLVSNFPKGFSEAGRIQPPLFRFSLMACACWEDRYIEEWLLYHRSIGFEHVYLYCNDDEPSALYRKVMSFAEGDSSFVTFVHYKYQGLQCQMLLHYMRNFAAETEFMMTLDIDEFLVLRELNDIAAFIETRKAEFDALYFNWCYFGTNGHATRPDGDVLLNYTRRQNIPTPFTKVLVNTARLPYAGFVRQLNTPVMHDYTRLDPSLRAVDVLGAPMQAYYADFPEQAYTHLAQEGVSDRILATAFVAHFHMKSDADFNLRVARGTQGAFHAQSMWGNKSSAERDQHNRNTNIVKDTYLRDYWLRCLDRAWQGSAFPGSPPELSWMNLSKGCAADQSSTLHAPRTPEADAAMLVSGAFTGGSQNHTELEASPWWQVDLGATRIVHAVVLFNRLDGVLDRVARFEVSVSEHGETWETVYRKTDASLYGGIDGTPYRCEFEPGVAARYVRVTIPVASGYLHFDQIEVYGTS